MNGLTSGRAVRWRAAVVEDHRLQRDRTAQILRQHASIDVVAVVNTLPEFLDWLRDATPEQRPHLLTLDLLVDRGEPADPGVVSELITSGLRVLVISAMAAPATVRDMVRAGVTGFIGKQDSVADIVDAAHAVVRGGRWESSELAAVLASAPERPSLSAQEERALILYASGLTLKSVAEHMDINRDTAKQYIERAKVKYANFGRPVRTKLDLHRVASQDGLIGETLGLLNIEGVDPSTPKPREPKATSAQP